MPTITDNFTGTNGAAVNGRTPSGGGAATWAASANYTIQGNQCQRSGSGTDLAYIDCGNANLTIQFTLAQEGSNAGALLRYVDANNWLGVYILDSYLHIVQNVGGTLNDPAFSGWNNDTVTITNGDVFSIDVNDTGGNTQVVIRQNGTEKLNKTSSGGTLNSASIGAGFFCSASQTILYDDLTITPNGPPLDVTESSVLVEQASITLHLTGNGTSWGGGTTFTVSGVTGTTKTAQNVVNATTATVTIETVGSDEGTLTVSDGTNSDTVAVTALIHSQASGNWSSTGTWLEGVVPANLYRASVGHAVTVDADTTVGRSPSNTTELALDVTAGGVTVASGKTFAVRGNVRNGNVAFTMNSGSTLELDASQAGTPGTNYKWTWGTASTQTSAGLVCSGTSNGGDPVGKLPATTGGNHCTVRGNSGGGNFQFVTGGNTDVGSYDCTYTDFLRVGTSSLDGLQTSIGGVTASVKFDKCTFDACGQVAGSAQFGGDVDHLLNLCRWKNSPGTANASLKWSAPNGGKSRGWTGNSFDQDASNATLGWTCTGNYFGGRLTGSFANGAWTLFQNNFMRLIPADRNPATQISSTIVSGDLTDCYWLSDATSGNPHQIQVDLSLSSITMDGMVWDYPYPFATDGGEAVLNQSAGPGTGVALIKNSIVLPSASDGNTTGAIHFEAGGWDIRIVHCTLHTGNEGGWMQNEGGADALAANTVTQIKNCVFWVPNGFSSGSFGPYKTWDVEHFVVNGGTNSAVNNAVLDTVTPTGCAHNYGWNMLDGQAFSTYPSAGKGYNLPFSAAPGTTDVDVTGGAGPRFADSSRSFVTWAVANGSAGSTVAAKVADGLSYLAADPSLVASVLSHVRAGFAPTNPAVKMADDNVSPTFGWAGAVQGGGGVATTWLLKA